MTLACRGALRVALRLLSLAPLQAALEGIKPAAGPDASRAGADHGRIAVYARSKLALPAGVLYRAMPQQAAACAHELFAVLRELDAQGVAHIWVEAPPDAPEWDGVRDRLARAAA